MTIHPARDQHRNPVHEGPGNVDRWAVSTATFSTTASVSVHRLCVTSYPINGYADERCCRVRGIDSRWWELCRQLC